MGIAVDGRNIQSANRPHIRRRRTKLTAELRFSRPRVEDFACSFPAGKATRVEGIDVGLRHADEVVIKRRVVVLDHGIVDGNKTG